MTVSPVHSSAIPSPSLPPEVREDLRRYAEAGGFSLRPDSNPWYAAADSVADLEEARAASTVLAELRGRDLPLLRDAAQRLGAVPGLTEPETAARVAALVTLLERLRGTLAVLRPEVYDADLDALLAATASSAWRGERGLRQSWLRRRALGRQARQFAVSGRTKRAELHDALASAAAARDAWRAQAAEDTRPALPTDHAFLEEAGQAAEAALTGLRELSRLLRPEQSLETVPLAELGALLDALAADEGTLYRLPRLHALRAGLLAQGLGELLADLTTRGADAAEVDALAGGSAAASAPAAVPEPGTEPEPEAGSAPDAAEIHAPAETEAGAETETEAGAGPEAAAAGNGPDTAEQPVAEAETSAVAGQDAAAQLGTGNDAADDATAEVAAEAVAEADAPGAADESGTPEAAASEAPAESADASGAEADEADASGGAPADPGAADPVASDDEASATGPASDRPEPAASTASVPSPVPAGDEVASAEAAVPQDGPEVRSDDAPAGPGAEGAGSPDPTGGAGPAEQAAAAPAAEEATGSSTPAGGSAAADEPAGDSAPGAAPAAAGRSARRPRKPAVTPGRPVTAYSPDELQALVRWIDSDGVERSDDELLRAAMKELGFARLGPRIKEALGAAVSAVRN